MLHRFLNSFKTAIFLAALFALVLWIGSFWGQTGLLIAFILGGLMNIIAYFFSDKIAIAAMQGRPVDERSAPDLIHMVRRLAENAGLPMPKVYICPHDAPNAFATGRNPRHAAVAVTQGALRLLTYEELEGVLAHELSHIKNRDTLISCVAATIAGAISYLAHLAFFFGAGSNNREGGGNPLALLLTILLAPIAAAMIQMAISRSREYIADHDAAIIAGTPLGLINALKKLDAYARRIPLVAQTPAMNHMFIVQPLSGESLASLFSTHPPIAKRIARLQEML